MAKIILDWETHFDRKSGYSLSKMTTEGYVVDTRFQPTGLVYKWLGQPAHFLAPHEVNTFLNSEDWSQHEIICHNTRFDGLILASRYGIQPKRWIDTMGMAAMCIRPFTTRVSLDKVSEFLLGEKKVFGGLSDIEGKYFDGLNSDQQARFIHYALKDVELTEKIFIKMCGLIVQENGREYGARIMKLIDMTLRMYLEPRLRLDTKVLEGALAGILMKKKALLIKTEASPEQLRSNQQFADMLRALGVMPPLKISPATGKETYAFAKTDAGFRALKDHPDDAVQNLHAARCGFKSTLAQTRAERLLDMAKSKRPLRVPLNFFGAHTGRYSGGEKINLQNLPNRSPLREAIIAPKGHRLVVVDASQIEARLLAWWAGQQDLVAAFAAGIDVYALFASTVYGYPVDKVNHPRERFVGKTGILGCGYQAGANRFWEMLRMEPALKDITIEEATKIHGVYRSTYTKIKKQWWKGTQMIEAMVAGREYECGFVTTSQDKLTFANGHVIHYPNIYWGKDKHHQQQHMYGPETGPYTNIYGGKITENCIQAAAWDIVMDVALRTEAAHPEWPLVLQVHDDLVYCVPKKQAKKCMKFVMEQMAIPPTGFEGVPLASEGWIGKSYGG